MYKEKFHIKSIHVDPTQSLNLKNLLEICEDMGMKDLNVINHPYLENLKQNRLWVINKSVFNINRLPKYDEEIIASSYAKSPTKLIFPRAYLIKDIKGNILVRGESYFVLVDGNTRQLLIPSNYGINFGQDKKGDTKPDFSFEEKELINHYYTKIVYSDLDVNYHVNNTRYASWIDDILKDKKDYKRFYIKYKKEIRLDEEVDIAYSDLSSDSIYFCGKTKDKENFEAYIEY